MLRYVLILLATISLSGCAGLFIAGAAATANVVTDTRTTKEIWQDSNVEFEIAALGNKAPYRGQVRIVASTYNGTVVLMGQASTAEARASFEQQVRAIKGVRVLHNQVKVKAPLSVSQVSNDSWITTKVKSALLTDELLKGVKIRVITEDRDVFLFGYVNSQQAEKATEIARNISGVKQVVRAFQNGEGSTQESNNNQ